MKKLLALVLLVLLFCTLTPQPATAQQINILYAVPEAGITLLLPAEWETITRHTPADDALFYGDAGVYETWMEYFQEYDIYLDSTNPDPAAEGQYITLYWLEQDSYNKRPYSVLDRNELVATAEQHIADWEMTEEMTYQIHRDANNGLTYLIYDGLVDYEDGEVLAFRDYDTRFNGMLLRIRLYSVAGETHEAALPLLEQTIASIRLAEGGAAGLEATAGAATTTNSELRRLGPSRNPRVYYVESDEDGEVIRQRGVYSLLQTLIAYGWLLLAFLLWRLLALLPSKLPGRRASEQRQLYGGQLPPTAAGHRTTQQRRQLYQAKLKQAGDLGIRLDWYKALYYCLLPFCLLAYPWLALQRLLPLLSGWQEILGNAEVRNLVLSALVLWLLLYYTRRRLQCFSRWSLPLLLLCLICYVAEKVLLYGQYISYLWLAIYALLALVLLVYFYKRRQLFGALPEFVTDPSLHSPMENNDDIED